MKEFGTGMVRCGFALFCLLGLGVIAAGVSTALGYFQVTNILLMPVFLAGVFLTIVAVGMVFILIGMILERVGDRA